MTRTTDWCPKEVRGWLPGSLRERYRLCATGTAEALLYNGTSNASSESPTADEKVWALFNFSTPVSIKSVEILLYSRELHGDSFGVDACSGPDNATCTTQFNCSVLGYNWPDGSAASTFDKISQPEDSTCAIGVTSQYWRIRFPCAGGNQLGRQPLIYSAQFHTSECSPKEPPASPIPSPPPSPPPPSPPPPSPPTIDDLSVTGERRMQTTQVMVLGDVDVTVTNQGHSVRCRYWSQSDSRYCIQAEIYDVGQSVWRRILTGSSGGGDRH